MSKAFQHFLESGKAMRWSFGLLGAGVAVGSFLSKVPEDHIGMVHHYGKGLEPEVLKPGWHITLPFYTVCVPTRMFEAVGADHARSHCCRRL